MSRYRSRNETLNMIERRLGKLCDLAYETADLADEVGATHLALELRRMSGTAAGLRHCVELKRLAPAELPDPESSR